MRPIQLNTQDNPPNEDKGGMTLVLGDPADNSTSGRSAFIDDKHYAAIETPGLSTIQSGEHGDHPLIDAPTGYLVSGEQLGVDNILYYPDHDPEDTEHPDSFVLTKSGFCHDCAFLKWGAWGARAGFQDFNDQGAPAFDKNGKPVKITADVHLGWWAAGDITAVDKLAALGGEATYSGHAIGNVANNLNGQGWNTYVATGNMRMDWNFSDRSGNLQINHFDTKVTPGGLSFSGAMAAPGVPNGNHFGGALSGGTPDIALSGHAAGSFVNNGPDKPAAGAIGNWNVGNDAYKATGIFAGSGTPQVPH